jgi:hypothetical protein
MPAVTEDVRLLEGLGRQITAWAMALARHRSATRSDEMSLNRPDRLRIPVIPDRQSSSVVKIEDTFLRDRSGERGVRLSRPA